MNDGQPGESSPRLLALDEQIVRPVEVLLGEETTIGRESSNHVVVMRREVSRLHARIVYEDGRYVISDAGSINGTYVNGRKLDAPYTLRTEDVIGLGTGPALLKFSDPQATFVPDQLRYDERLLLFFFRGRALELTPGQTRLLRLLYRQRGRLCTRDECAMAVWGEPYDSATHAAALDQLVTTLRARLKQIDSHANLIRTRRGMGYVLEG
ncbi:MAG: FHA domain-containing protein [Oscillochloris sp.]|nr:FHA domain-containing protein [Oscillochloris sp.]